MLTEFKFRLYVKTTAISIPKLCQFTINIVAFIWYGLEINKCVTYVSKFKLINVRWEEVVIVFQDVLFENWKLRSMGKLICRQSFPTKFTKFWLMVGTFINRILGYTLFHIIKLLLTCYSLPAQNWEHFLCPFWDNTPVYLTGPETGIYCLNCIFWIQIS